MTTETIMEIATGFGFDTIDLLNGWSTCGHDSIVWHKDELSVLYTDGDSGIAILSLSEIDPEGGLLIKLVNCGYCNFDMTLIECVHDELLDSAFSVATVEMLGEKLNDFE